MKGIAYLSLMLILMSCFATKEANQKNEESNFAYVLPLSIEEEIWKLVKNRNLENVNLFFQLRREKEFYHLLITPTKNINKEYFGYFKISKSNRKLLLNDKLYPIVFDSDYDFGSLIDKIEPLDKRKEKYMADEYMIRRGAYTINDSTFGIRFTKTGEILP